MNKTWLAIVLNFFFPGAGYLVAGTRPPVQAVAWLVGVIGLTFVEFSVQTAAPALYWPMFASVLIMNTAFAWDIWREARQAQPAT